MFDEENMSDDEKILFEIVFAILTIGIAIVVAVVVASIALPLTTYIIQPLTGLTWASAHILTSLGILMAVVVRYIDYLIW